MLHHKITIVAEVGQNHCGDMGLAEKLIDLAKENGADLVKFQLYDSRKLYGEYQSTELSRDRAFSLFEYGQKVGIEVFFSIFDAERVRWCEEMGVKRYKVAYSKKDNWEIWKAISKTGKLCWVSGKSIYCIPKYPVSSLDLHFSKVDFQFSWNGYSDHTIGLDAAKIALARGCSIIEKHFAIDHQTGIDAPWSMTPLELRELRQFADCVSDAL